MLATSAVGKAAFLITHDQDVLDIQTAQRRRFKFEIVTPVEFLKLRESGK